MVALRSMLAFAGWPRSSSRLAVRFGLGAPIEGSAAVFTVVKLAGALSQWLSRSPRRLAAIGASVIWS